MLTRLPKGLRSAELGVMAGDYSSKIFQYTEPAHHIMIDAWEHRPHVDPVTSSHQMFHDLYYERVQKRFTLQLRHGVGTIIRARTADALKMIPDNSLDWAYVDGDHKRHAALGDLQGAKRIVKPDGFIAGHDYCYSHGEVVYAVADFLAENEDLRIVLLTTDLHPSFVIARRDMDEHYAKLFMG